MQFVFSTWSVGFGLRGRLKTALVSNVIAILAAGVTLNACQSSSDSNGSSATSGSLSPEEVAALSPADVRKLSNEQITALDKNIRYMNDEALAALTWSNNAGPGQITALSAQQIEVLTPDQVRRIGAQGEGGSFKTAHLADLNDGAWKALASSSEQVEALLAAEIPQLGRDKITALGENVQYLSDEALAALTWSNNAGPGQINALSGKQIEALTPAQVRRIGAQGEGGTFETAHLADLNDGAWKALASNSKQVEALLAAEIPQLGRDKITALGENVQYLSDEALAALTWSNNAGPGQINALSGEQVDALTPAQVRRIGAQGEGGSFKTAHLADLNDGAWDALAGNSKQVEALLAAEIPPLGRDKITALGENVQYLSDEALAALTWSNNAGPGQINALSGKQIDVLTPAQVRRIGAIGEGGTFGTAHLTDLNDGAWTALAGAKAQVEAITSDEVPPLGNQKITALGKNVRYLGDEALGALTANNSATTGQIYALTSEQIKALSPVQIGIIAGAYDDTGISQLNSGAFASLSESQISILTDKQKESLSEKQHEVCGC